MIKPLMMMMLGFMHGTSASGPLADRFGRAVAYLKTKVDSGTGTAADRLECFGLYKQATQGDAVIGSSVWNSLIEERRAAWQSKAGLGSEAAMEQLLSMVDRHFAGWDSA